MHSALKQGGTPLYEMARQGVTVPRASRRITIHGLELLERSGARMRIRVACSKGTYVRVLAEDLGLDERGQVVRPVELLQQRRQVRDDLAGAQQVHAGQQRAERVEQRLDLAGPLEQPPLGRREPAVVVAVP